MLPINARARIQLERMGVRCLGDLAQIAEADLRANGHIGATSLERLCVLLRSVAVDFAELTTLPQELPKSVPRTPDTDETPVVALRPWLGAVVNKLQAADLNTLGAVRAASRAARLSRIPGLGMRSEALIDHFLHEIAPDRPTA
ncbi:hypothetical protein SNE35_27490 [Paucibacter sp. R3-3]|uniref:RNA polymerase alpha subunit C-terminal domain-containing protein n=1 Tax=Roseateles agri TaxID=3098619 RepID=A0ABU5DT01_9BURK|nr:hypothetical protein [Paucibacter sp. R3-3]MDY0748272.1 hypothetical protein [Paucibacter sp. R3-3]